MQTEVFSAPDIQTLTAALKRAREVRAYRDLFQEADVTDPKSWARLPVLTKADLMDQYPFGLLAVPRSQLATYHESSGTTGQPTAAYFTDRDWDDVTSRFLRNAIDLTSADTVLIKTPYSMVSTALQMHIAARRVGALVIPADNRSSNMPYPKVIRLLRDLSVTVAWCMPTELALWAEAARLMGLDPEKDFPNLRGFLVAGEPLSDARRKYLSKEWGGKPIYVDYGSTETGSLAGDCAKQKLHLWSDRMHFEVLDRQSGVTRPFGSGELVVTTLHRQAMPLVRYLLGDSVEISREKCRCGSPLPTLRVAGRKVSSVAIGSQEIFQADLEEIIFSEFISGRSLFWRAKPDMDSIAIEIEGRWPDQLCDEIAHLIFARYGIRANVLVVPIGTIVDRTELMRAAAFRKPKFLFSATECWDDGLAYS